METKHAKPPSSGLFRKVRRLYQLRRFRRWQKRLAHRWVKWVQIHKLCPTNYLPPDQCPFCILRIDRTSQLPPDFLLVLGRDHQPYGPPRLW